MSDSGPPYPNPNPAPGSNAIGSFTIGVSPIGTISPFNPFSTLISQYSNSPILAAMITAFNAAMDFTENFDDFLDFILNIETAQGYGLDVLGRICGVSRTIPLPGGASYLGFEEAGTSWTGFGSGGFYSGGAISTNFTLSDSDFRTLILAKMASNICDGSIPAVNKILLTLFPNRGPCYVQDKLNMSLVYVFEFPLNPIELGIIELSGVLPSPAGVAVSISSL
jgi:hypothetical protein